MDLDKLTPAPWEAGMLAGGEFTVYSTSAEPGRNGVCTMYASGWLSGNLKHKIDDGEFIALARNALDVMMRRGWGVMRLSGVPAWRAVDWEGREILSGFYDDPFTALVQADRWYREHVEKQA